MNLPGFLHGGGDMGARMRAADWSRTPLGRPDTWPQSLRTAISICLGSGFPMIVLWGPQYIALYNDGYAPMLGAKHPAALGRPLRETWPEIWDVIGPMMDGVVASGTATWVEDQMLVLERNGFPEECYFSYSFGPLRGDSGDVDGIFTAVLETTRRVLDERRLQLLKSGAEDANRAKDHFLAVLGHELRNPLAPILTAARLLEMQGPQDPPLQRLRETIVRQTLQLSKIVDDLLDVGRIITGKLRLEQSRVELGALVRQAIESCAPLIQRRHHTLSVSLPVTPVYVEADSARLVQVLTNLLTNAAKYMPDGGRIEVSATEQAGAAMISVRDKGVGIAPDMIERVFDRFVQAEEFAGTESERGLGIGLSVVKAIVDLHGGSVAARSDGPGTGTEFTVRLPIADRAASSAVTT